MVSNETNEVFSIQTVGLTKRFAKKRHQGFFEFLRKNSKSSCTEVTVALSKVNLQICSGELFGLLGPNGSGKTTLIKCLSTILIPDEGKVIVNGFDVQKETAMVRASIGIVVGGERTLYWKLTARDNLLYFASLYKMPRAYAKKRVEELLEAFQPSDNANERLENYSSGMRQKVAIARALLHDPPILLLDEPTLGLDPNFARYIRKQIRAISEKYGKTVLLTTHYMAEAEQLCDRVAFINKGNIVAVDKPSKFKAMVKEKAVVEVAVYNPPQAIENYIRPLLPDAAVVKFIPDNEIEGNLLRIKIICPDAEDYVETIIDGLRQKNVRIASLNVGVPTLEDVFVKLTGAELTAAGAQ